MRRLRANNLLDKLPDGLILSDEAGTVHFLNEQASTLLGHDLDDQHPLHLRDLCRDDWTKFERQLDSLKYGLTFLWPMHLYTRQGERLWAELNTRRVEENLIAISFHAVTATPWINPAPPHQLTEQEQNLHLLLDLFPEPAWLCDSDANVIYCNQAWFDYTGQTLSEARGRGWKRSLHPDDFDKVASLSKHTVSTGAFYDITYRLCRADGQYRWQHARSTSFRLPSGKIARWFGTCVDVHDQMLLREALEAVVEKRTAELREREERFSQLFEQGPDGYFLTTPEGKILLANGAAEQLTGRSAKELAACTVQDLGFVLPSRRKPGRGAKPPHPAGETVEFSLKSIDGQMREIALRVVRLTIGDQPQMLIVARDVTEQRALERSLLRVCDEERQRIGQELHDGLCQELVGAAIAAKMLEQSLVKRSKPEAAKAAEIRKLLNGLISEARQISSGLAPVDMRNEGITMALNILATQMNRLNGILCEFQGTNVRINDNTIATHIYRIAQQAVTNAYQHANPTKVTITLAENAKSIILTVHDDGTGINENAWNSHGMGLHSMEYRSRLIHATLEVTSRARDGTTVRCTLPKLGLT